MPSSNQICLKLSSGFSMPAVGFGTSYEFKRSSETQKAVQRAFESGYRHFDCAHVYGNEEDVGVALEQEFSKGNVKREDVFITSKLWMAEMSPESVKPACLGSLKRLGLNYLDLYLIHFPTAIKRPQSDHGVLVPIEKDSDGFALALDVDYVDTWKEMQKLVKDGLVRSIGVSNFNKRQLERVLACAEIPPAVNQIECHPYLQQNKLIEFCKEKNIVVTAYTPLSGKTLIRKQCKAALDELVIKEIAEKHQKTPAQVILRFHLQRGIAMVPFSMNPNNIASNFRVFEFELDEEDMQKMAALNEGLRFRTLPEFRKHPHFPFEDEFPGLYTFRLYHR